MEEDARYSIVGFQMMALETSSRMVMGDSGSQHFAGSPTLENGRFIPVANCPEDGYLRSPGMAREISGSSTRLTVSTVCVARRWSNRFRGPP